MVNFRTETTDVGGNLIITGRTFPTFASHDPLSQLWSKVKRRIEERYDILSCAVILRPTPETTVVSIFPNWARQERTDMSQKLYAQRFRDTFESQTQEFEDVILAWLDDDEFGHEAYERILKSASPLNPKNVGATREAEKALELLVDDFMLKIGLREPNRIQRKRAAEKKVEKSLHLLEDAKPQNPYFDDAS